MKYRQIKTDFWEDPYILDLSDREKVLFLYLFTNPRVNMCGIYELSNRTILYSLGGSLEEITRIKNKFEADQKYSFYKSYVFIHNFTRHNTFSPAKNVAGSFIREFNSIPAEVRYHFLVKCNHAYPLPIPEVIQVTVMDKVMDKGVGGRVGGRVQIPVISYRANEDISPSEVPL